MCLLVWDLKFVTCTHCRNEGKSAQEVSQQLKPPSSSWLGRTSRRLDHVISYDASLASWQELYRAVSALDFGAGVAVGLAAVQQVVYGSKRSTVA